jgi:hypothetical protein
MSSYNVQWVEKTKKFAASPLPLLLPSLYFIFLVMDRIYVPGVLFVSVNLYLRNLCSENAILLVRLPYITLT